MQAESRKSNPVRQARTASWAMAMLTALALSWAPVPAAADEAQEAEIRAKVAAAAATLQIDGTSNDPGYGYTPDDPLKIGGLVLKGDDGNPGTEMALRMAAYFSRVAYKGIQSVHWERQSNCCPFDSPAGYKGKGLLDIYLLTVQGERPFKIFVNHYESGPLKAPSGMIAFESAEAREVFSNAVDELFAKKSESATKTLQTLAEKGSVIATYYRAIAELVAENSTAAFPWFRKAAEQGHASSQFAVAMALRRGEDVPQDWAAGTEWLERAAANGDARARERLAYDLASGQTMQKDPARAALLSLLAAEQGQPGSQVAYGMALIQGNGVQGAAAEGLYWLAIARNAGDTQAADLYDRIAPQASQEVRETIEQAAKRWPQQTRPSEVLLRARFGARAGDPQAQFAFGRMRLNGVLAPSNEVDGLKFIMLAAEAGHAKAKALLQNAPFSEDVRAKARAAADAWRASSAQ